MVQVIFSSNSKIDVTKLRIIFLKINKYIISTDNRVIVIAITSVNICVNIKINVLK